MLWCQWLAKAIFSVEVHFQQNNALIIMLKYLRLHP
jgi:hypothetical protein